MADPGRDEATALRERVEASANPRLRLVEADPDVTTVILVGEPHEADERGDIDRSP